MEKNNVLVSVIVPCYNQAQYLAETLDSVLAQTYHYWECIIVNDGSPDNTEEIAQEYCAKDSRFHYYYKENSGVADTRNYGISKSNGYYILPLDSDDKIASTYLEKAIKYFELNTSAKLVYSEVELFGTEHGIWQLSPYSHKNILKKNCIVCSCVYKRLDFNLTCGYNPNMVYGWEDWDFLLSLLKPEDKVFKIPETLFYYRIKESSRSTKLEQKKKQMLLQLMLNHPDYYAQYIDYLVEYFEGIDYKELFLKIRSSKAYCLGKFLLTPIKIIRKLFNL